MVGVGILAYNHAADLTRCVTSVKMHTPGVDILVFDNSDKTREVETFVKKYRDIQYLTSRKNVGCTVSRNIMYRTFKRRHPQAQWLVIMDQDVEVLPGWLPAMISTASKYPSAGIVAWPLANMRPFPVDMRNGCITAAASVCHLHRMKALEDVEALWGGPWDERFFFFRFDSLMCDRMNLLGWRTHLILNRYNPNISWEQQRCLIKHHHPHRGVKSHPRYNEITRASDALYKKIMREERWTPYDPLKQPYNWKFPGISCGQSDRI